MNQYSPDRVTLEVTFLLLEKTFDANVSNIAHFVSIAKIYNESKSLQDQQISEYTPEELPPNIINLVCGSLFNVYYFA